MDAFMSRDEFDFVGPLVEAGALTYINTFRDEYSVVHADRPDGWDRGEDDESATVIEAGYGRLIVDSAGPGDVTDTVIVNLTTARLHVPATSLLADIHRVTVNGRPFLVESVATLSRFGHLVKEASLTERNGGD